MLQKSQCIETERLLLRRFLTEDIADLHEYLSDREVVEYEPYQPMELSAAAQELDERIESDEMIAVVLKSSDKLIGNIYLGKREWDSLELGYVFNKKYWGQGYAKESCRMLIQTAFSAGIHRIYAECDPCNENSWRLLESLGFTREAHFEKNVYFWKDAAGNPMWKDTFVYALLNK